MPVHAKAIMQGTSQGGEVWSCGLSYTGAVALFTQASLQAWAQGIADFIEAMPTTNAGLIDLLSAQGAVTTVRCETRQVDDSLLLAAEAPLTPAKSGLGTCDKVFQSTACFSLRTAIPGRSYRGRFYWPAWQFTNTAAMRFSTVDQGVMVASFVSLNNGILAAQEAAEPGVDAALCVRSRLLNEETLVTSVAVGDVPDVQRRRRDDLVENYVSLAV